LVKSAGLGAGGTRVSRDVLRLPHWPAALAGVRVAVLADLHTGSPQVDEDRLSELVVLVERERPDVVALLGDYIDPSVPFGEWIEPESIAARLGSLAPRLGTFAVLGNHDWGHAGERMATALRDAGIVVLENSAQRTGDGFWIAGLGDVQMRSADIDRALAGVPLDEPVVLLSHNPDVFPRVPDRVALTISGHTHGAQVDIPVVRDKTTPSRFGARYTGGHIVEDGRHLYASAGIGTSRLPVRFRTKPEIALLELRG
jgi:predicted MPP superfamily phosphohydrolase